jgi:hypothetical protein
MQHLHSGERHCTSEYSISITAEQISALEHAPIQPPGACRIGRSIPSDSEPVLGSRQADV